MQIEWLILYYNYFIPENWQLCFATFWVFSHFQQSNCVQIIGAPTHIFHKRIMSLLFPQLCITNYTLVASPQIVDNTYTYNLEYDFRWQKCRVRHKYFTCSIIDFLFAPSTHAHIVLWWRGHCALYWNKWNHHRTLITYPLSQSLLHACAVNFILKYIKITKIYCITRGDSREDPGPRRRAHNKRGCGDLFCQEIDINTLRRLRTLWFAATAFNTCERIVLITFIINQTVMISQVGLQQQEYRQPVCIGCLPFPNNTRPSEVGLRMLAISITLCSCAACWLSAVGCRCACLLIHVFCPPPAKLVFVCMLTDLA